MLTSDLNLSKNCKRIEILKCVLRTFIIIIITYVNRVQYTVVKAILLQPSYISSSVAL